MIANWMKVVGVLSSGAVIASVVASEPISAPIEPVVPPPAATSELPKLPKLPDAPKLPEQPKLPSVPKSETRNTPASNSSCHPSYSIIGFFSLLTGDPYCSAPG